VSSWNTTWVAGSMRRPPTAPSTNGEVTTWEPPHRLAYLWYLRTERSSATDVEIRFAPVDDGTRVEIEHAGWERLGDAAETWRGRNHAGWSTLRHSHVLGQNLHCTDGLGLVVSRDVTVIHLRPGDTDYTPPGEEHGHGANQAKMMCHLAMLESTLGGESTGWLEPVTDEEDAAAHRA
jgi:hypothetical protein